LKLVNNYVYKIPKIWFYEIKGVQDVATVKELKIAKQLSKLKAKVFLESRAYIRQSLGALFDLDPFDIPLTANPGERPKLPKGMGNISLSHCKDAIIVAWHKNKIGIDIERKDRDFNYENLAKKYFVNTNKLEINDLLNRTLILRQWCALEAAIKCCDGKLSKDIKEWQYSAKNKQLIHKKKNLNLQCAHLNFHEWTISIALECCSLTNPIICSSKNC
tara:strand:+ start:384 stop:1037 length:654 start_codon:yes stop_codon:yes gene_type:complete